MNDSWLFGDIKQYYHLAPAIYSAPETYEGNWIQQETHRANKTEIKHTPPNHLNWVLAIGNYGGSPVQSQGSPFPSLQG